MRFASSRSRPPSLTALEAISTNGGQILNSTLIRGGWGVPLVDYGGSVGGLSTNGKTLVLGKTGFGACNPRGCTLLRHTTRFQVINPKTLRRARNRDPERRLRLRRALPRTDNGST